MNQVENCQFIYILKFPFALEKRNGNNSFRRGVSRTTAESKMELFVTKVNDWILLTFVTKHSILDFVVALDRSLFRMGYSLVAEVETKASNRMKISH